MDDLKIKNNDQLETYISIKDNPFWSLNKGTIIQIYNDNDDYESYKFNCLNCKKFSQYKMIHSENLKKFFKKIKLSNSAKLLWMK